jgi:hypothetical protein
LWRGDEWVLDTTGVEVSFYISSVIHIEENVERGGMGGALGSNADRISKIIEEIMRMSLWMA